jgi:NAD(P)-dependent dehydrogenase (short-subunit alcohol dehydrogenase family)
MVRRVALVTGASRGIGRQTALVLARDGWDVAVTARTLHEGTGSVPSRSGGAEDVPVEGSLETTTRLLAEAGAAALAVPMDLLNLDSVRGAAATVLATWGRIDLLVNNAIVHLPGGHARVVAQDLEVAAQVLRGNFLAQLALVQAVLPAMAAQGGGTIVNMASGSATSDPPAPPDEGGWSLVYAASKAACGRIAGAVNAEYAAAGVRCFDVDPGFVVTEAMRVRGGAEAIEQNGYEVAPHDAAGRVIAWLASDPGASAWLGRVIWSPKLAAAL